MPIFRRIFRFLNLGISEVNPDLITDGALDVNKYKLNRKFKFFKLILYIILSIYLSIYL